MSRLFLICHKGATLASVLFFLQGVAAAPLLESHSQHSTEVPLLEAGVVQGVDGEVMNIFDPEAPEIQQQFSSLGADEASGSTREMDMNAAAVKIAKRVTRPCCLSLNQTRHDCFFRIGTMTISHLTQIKGQKAQFENLGGASGSDLGCASWGDSHLFLYELGPNNGLIARTYSHGVWSRWQLLPAGILKEVPSCRALKRGVIQCMGRSLENHPVSVRFSKGEWKKKPVPVHRLWTPFRCVLPLANRMDCFAVGDDSGMRQYSWTFKSGWELQRSLGGFCHGTPSPVVTGPEEMTVFVNSSQGRLAYKSYNGQEWSGWDLRTLWGDGLYTDAECVHSTRHRVDCFVGLMPGGRLHRIAWNGYRWSKWIYYGYTVADRPICRYFDDERIWCLLLIAPPKWTLRAFYLLNFTSIALPVA